MAHQDPSGTTNEVFQGYIEMGQRLEKLWEINKAAVVDSVPLEDITAQLEYLQYLLATKKTTTTTTAQEEQHIKPRLPPLQSQQQQQKQQAQGVAADDTDHDSVNEEGDKGWNSVQQRYGKWKTQLAQNSELSHYLHQEGRAALKLFGYEPYCSQFLHAGTACNDNGNDKDKYDHHDHLKNVVESPYTQCDMTRCSFMIE
jgi:hypothetical protein